MLTHRSLSIVCPVLGLETMVSFYSCSFKWRVPVRVYGRSLVKEIDSGFKTVENNDICAQNIEPNHVGVYEMHSQWRREMLSPHTL